jgi:hypothetical protein
MEIIETSQVTQSRADAAQAIYTFPALIQLSDGTILLTCRSGSSKDSVDETIELYRSTDNGTTWSQPKKPYAEARVNGQQSSFRLCYLTEISSDHLLAASMWIDRETHADKPFFNPQTEGCLPMGIFLADSFDRGETWSEWRAIDLPEELGPPSLTNPLIKLPDGTLLMNIETNKQYYDESKWYQRVVCLHSSDLGQTWGNPIDAGCDPSGRIFNWDQRVGLAMDGTLATFTWTYDTVAQHYLNVHRRVSKDNGYSWSEAEDIGITDQAAHPAILPDGRTVFAWVDRYHTQSIRARLAPHLSAQFDAASEVVIYAHQSNDRSQSDDTGALLDEMSIWSFGLPYGEALANGDVLVVYYAGDSQTMDIYCARIYP